MCNTSLGSELSETDHCDKDELETNVKTHSNELISCKLHRV
jgi:hypothetical protein